jgi:hypothetical protein
MQNLVLGVKGGSGRRKGEGVGEREKEKRSDRKLAAVKEISELCQKKCGR